MSQPIEGERFSLNYLNHGVILRDSKRARRRVYRLFNSLSGSHEEYAEPLELATGADVPYAGYGYDWERWYEKAELRGVLDSITRLGQI